jgi:protein-S-isoprenylcysteine O-methyltransferase Ste14
MGLIILGSVVATVVVVSVCIVTHVRRTRNREKFLRRPYRQ